MDDPVLAHQHEGREHLACKPSDKRRCESGKPIGLDEFVQVDAQELGDDAKMVAERKVLIHLQDVVLLLGILNKL